MKANLQYFLMKLNMHSFNILKMSVNINWKAVIIAVIWNIDEK
jgi:hypothetical protein